MVERSELAALEFLMSKQPRGNVRVGGGNTAGARVFDVFSEVKVLHKRLQQAMDRKSHQESKVILSNSSRRTCSISATCMFFQMCCAQLKHQESEMNTMFNNVNYAFAIKKIAKMEAKR